MKRLRSGIKRHKVKIAVAFTLVVMGVAGFMLWFFHFRKLGREDIKRRLNTVNEVDESPPPIAAAVPNGVTSFTTNTQFLPRTRDQGSCGSCTTFSMANTLGISFSKQNRLKKAVSLSPQLLLACRTKNRVSVYGREYWKRPCRGFWTLKHAQFLRDGYDASGQGASDFAAMPLYDDLPYSIGSIDSGNRQCVVTSGGMQYDKDGVVVPGSCGSVMTKFENTCSASGPLGGREWTGFKVISIHVISRNGDRDKMSEVKDAIQRYGCVAMSFNVYDNMHREAQSSPYEYDPSRGARKDGGHAVCCVGWKPGYWLILNSWGREWGCSPSGGYVPLSNGYFYLRFGAMKDTIFAVRGARVTMPSGRPLPVSASEVDETLPLEPPAPRVVPPRPPSPPRRKKRSSGFCVIL